MLSKSPTPINPRNIAVSGTHQLFPDHSNRHVAVDPITLMINECVVILLAMRKMNRWSQSGVAAILGAGDIFGEDDGIVLNLGLSGRDNGARANGAAVAPNSNPLHSSFLQLRAILMETPDIYAVDSLTLLQPFLMAIESSTTSGHVTALALNAITKLLDYDILLLRLKNLQGSLIQLILLLTHCRFEASDQNTDDSVLLKVLRLLELIVDSPLSSLLPNAVVSEVIQTCLSLACNKRRSEVLRRAAEMAMVLMTIRIFLRLRELAPEQSNTEEISTNYAELPADVMGSTAVDEGDHSSAEPSTPSTPKKLRSGSAVLSALPRKNFGEEEKQFDIVCINEFFGILISMISPLNQYQHMELTRVFALYLINTAIEVAGDDIPRHASLMGLVLDPVLKDVLLIITNTDSPALLLAALRLFCTMAIVLHNHLKLQIELTFNLLFRSILPAEKKGEDSIKGNKTAVSNRVGSSKELIVESLSLLWTRSPQFFSQLFVEFDCDFERSDMATSFIHFLCKLALPESASVATDNVPPICLEGLLSLIAGINDRVKGSSRDSGADIPHHLIVDKEKKTSFVKATDIFNESPKKGIAALCAKGFIKDPNDPKELAEFFFHKSTRLNKKMLGEYLAKPSNIELLKHFMHLFEFDGLRVDEALRLMLKAFRLPGESQQIERIVELFAEAYVECQSDQSSYSVHEPDEEPVAPDRDSVFVLSYSIILLNTDLHNPQVKKQMDLDAYKRNLKGVNNGKNFPEWYLSKIYSSIRDREIIMPEEHHGTDKWFDDAWHNLISSQSKYALEHGVSIHDFDLPTLCQFDRLLFMSIVDEAIDTLIKVFQEATDDNIITKLMSSIDKCANICISYGLTESVNNLTAKLAELTTLSDKKFLNINADENVRAGIPITQINIEKKNEAIVISDMAVHFGRDFKAQLSTVVLFRLIKKPDCRVTESWDAVTKIILTLFENCMINPNLFSEFQKKLQLPPLNKVKPRYVIQRMKPLKDSGLLSTFSSFLKGYSDDPPEPSDQEVESTLSTIDCVRSVNVPGIFDTVSKGSVEELTTFIDILLANLPEYSDEKRRFFETEVMFLFEIAVCFSLIIKEPSATNKVLDKLVMYLKLDKITKKGYIRLCVYLYLVGRQSEAPQKELFVETLTHLNTFDKDVLVKYGAALNQTLFSLVDDESALKPLITEEQYWKLLRLVGSTTECADEVLDFVGLIVKNSPEEINEHNYVAFLGLLDEVSSLGAIGAHVEQLKESDAENAVDAEEVKKSIEISKKSVSLTGEIASAQHSVSYPLIQALAHQCFNPCREVRAHAIQVLQLTLLSSQFTSGYTAFGVYEYGLFPLLSELEKEEVFHTDAHGFPDTHQQILSLVSKVFLQFHSELSEEDRLKIWLGILDNFVLVNQLNAQYLKAEVRESSSETMKNMILVLHNEFLRPETDIWESTWKTLEPIYPNMKGEISEAEEITSSNVENSKETKKAEILPEEEFETKEAESATESGESVEKTENLGS